MENKAFVRDLETYPFMSVLHSLLDFLKKKLDKIDPHGFYQSTSIATIISRAETICPNKVCFLKTEFSVVLG